jgi:hypothetical protein
VPVEAIVYPTVPEVVDGADQPEGTVTATAPLFIPPVPAAKVKLNVVEAEVSTAPGETARVPEPSGAVTTPTSGEVERAVRMPDAVEASSVTKLEFP